MRKVGHLALIGVLCGSATQARSPEPCRVLGSIGGQPVKQTGDGLITFTANMDVNTDGALHSYAADDLGHFAPRPAPRKPVLTTDHALNVICNGVNIMQRSASGPRLIYNYKQCGPLIAEFKRIRASAGWTPADGRYVDFYAIARQPDPQRPGRFLAAPCERDGYYVSQTSRSLNPSVSVCDPEHWIDAARVAAVVVPIKLLAAHGVGMFDLVGVRRPGERSWRAAIVGDSNERALGEGTLLLAQQVTGRGDPANYRETLATAPKGLFEYIVFPGSRSAVGARSNAMQPRIEAAATHAWQQHDIDRRTILCR